MLKNNYQKEKISLDKAEKHVQISLKVRDIINQMYPKYCVYLATHCRDKNYKEKEKESGEKFWSLQLRSYTDKEGLKHPDIIVTDSEIIKYLIEVKWGVINGCLVSDSDIKTIVKGSEKNKIKKARQLGGILHSNGPAISNGRHYFNNEFIEKKEFIVNNETKFVLVSDFQMMKDVFAIKDYKDILLQLKEQSDIFVLADIHKHVGDILSLQEIIQLDC